MKKNYDIIIIGAGPAGLSAARYLSLNAKGGAVLLLDRNRTWEYPVSCAEGVTSAFKKVIPLKENWVRLKINKAVLHTPDNSTMTYHENDGGYIIDRRVMQKDIVDECTENGIETDFDADVKDVVQDGEGRGSSVILKNGKTAGSRIVIDCSGPFSRLGRHHKIPWKARDLEPSIFAHISNVDFKSDTIHIYVGQKICPGGYAWAFPRDRSTLNAGIVIGNRYKKGSNIKDLLNSFLKTSFPGAKVEQYYSGSIPCFTGRHPLAKPGFIKAGDSGATVNPISRAGIREAMLSGKIAGIHALKMLECKNLGQQKRVCSKYKKELFKQMSKNHLKLSKVKPELAKIPDKDYNRAVKKLNKTPQEKLTMSKIFKVTLSRSPRLVWALRHFL